jgi:hypothetical protein
LIIFSMKGFSLGWNVEVEKHVDELKGRGGSGRNRRRARREAAATAQS